MVTCEDMDRLLTPYLDGEVTAGDRRAVAGHLECCAQCARRAAAEAAARHVLAVRCAALSPRAPAALRRRCEALTGRRASRHPIVGWRAFGLATASVVVAALGAGLVFGVVTHSTSLLVAELVLDHVKCFALFEPRVVSADPRMVSSQLTADYGWSFSIPGSRSDQRLVLLGARRCYSTDGSVAHVLYRHAGRPLSLFLIPSDVRADARVAMAGRTARVWSKGTTTFVMLGDESDREMQPIAAYFRSARF
jgi:anti-sigma factor RsiW